MKQPFQAIHGPVTDPVVALDLILAAYLRSTDVKLGVLTTRRSFIDDATDRDNASMKIEASLKEILNKYYYTVKLKVIEREDPDNGASKALTINLELADDGVSIKVGWLANIKDGALNRLERLDMRGSI